MEIAVGDCHGREIILSPDVWKELLDHRCAILAYFRRDDEARDPPPPPMSIAHLTLRYSTINNLKILRFETQDMRLSLSTSTILGLFNFEYCINRIVGTLLPLTAHVDAKLYRFKNIAASASVNAIRDSEYFDRDDLLDCELLALFI